MNVMKEPVYFLKLELENVRCFGSRAILDLSDGIGDWKKWTVIFGDNGTGKTTLLQLIAGLENSDIFWEQHSWQSEIKFLRPKLGEILNRHSIDIRNTENNSRTTISVFFNSIRKNAIYPKNHSDIRVDNPKKGKFVWSFFNDIEISGFYCFGYGANRTISRNSLSESKSENSETLFNDEARLINAEEWLLQLDYAASKDSEIKEFAITKRDQVKQILIDLLPDIHEIRFTTPTKENLKSTVEFKTPFGYWVTIHQLSLGYKTMVAWMVDLAARMFERYPDSNNPLAEPAIVLVDEIDLHLHPKWQRKIFGYLSEKFPKTQFIVTAHSPLIVQSAPKDANIVVLRKEGDHVIIDNNIESVQNWRLDQIMTSDLFGIESSRGPETEKWLEERKVLMQKETLTHQEKIRLEELNKKANELPTADDAEDIEAMEIIRKAAEYVKRKKVHGGND
jgi:predicted ATP-binding protein involved in virulence